MIWVGQNSISYLSLLVIYVCLKRGKNLTLKTCAPDFSARLMTKLYAKIKGARAVSLFDFLKTWQVWIGSDLLQNNSRQFSIASAGQAPNSQVCTMDIVHQAWGQLH